MITGIDHFAILVPDLEQAAANYRALGFNVVVGGRHPTATHNALIGLADGSYIELIAFHTPSIEHGWWKYVDWGGGVIDYCMATDDLAGDVAHGRAAGIRYSPIGANGRTRPDGYHVQWRYALPEADDGIVPFIIEDVTPRSERVPTQTDHPNGVAGIARFTVAVSETKRYTGYFLALFGQPGAPVLDEELGARGLRYKAGAHEIDLLAPARVDSPLTSFIAQRGGGAYSVALAASRPIQPDLARLGGARISFVQPE